MANEFRCSDCDGDGTRCDCHKRRGPWLSPEQKLAQRIAGLEAEVAAGLAELRDPKRFRS